MPVRETRTIKLTLSARQWQIIDDAIKVATKDISLARYRDDKFRDEPYIAGRISIPTAEQCLTLICGQWLSPIF
jgi:hypothetical protein